MRVIGESGYDEALLGLSLSYNSPMENMPRRARLLAHKQGGHNGFLEMIMLWIDITAPRYFWQQADRYRLSARQSESTMHTLLKEELTQEHFAGSIPVGFLSFLNLNLSSGKLDVVKNLLPEGFLQRRIWMLSYKTLQNIYTQRKTHKLKEWQHFCSEILLQIQHPEFIEHGE